MQTLFSHLMTTMLVAHTLLGCCRHHQHCDREEACSHVEHGHHASTCQGECCDQGGTNHQPGHSDDCQTECFGVCTYLPSERSPLEIGSQAAAVDQHPTSTTIILPAAHGPSGIAGTLTSLPPPLHVRLHLANCVLLV